MLSPELLPQPSPLLPETASTTSPAATRAAKNSGDRLSAHACRSITPKSLEIPRIASRRMSWMMPRSSELALRIVTLIPGSPLLRKVRITPPLTRGRRPSRRRGRAAVRSNGMLDLTRVSHDDFDKYVGGPLAMSMDFDRCIRGVCSRFEKASHSSDEILQLAIDPLRSRRVVFSAGGLGRTDRLCRSRELGWLKGEGD